MSEVTLALNTAQYYYSSGSGPRVWISWPKALDIFCKNRLSTRVCSLPFLAPYCLYPSSTQVPHHLPLSLLPLSSWPGCSQAAQLLPLEQLSLSTPLLPVPLLWLSSVTFFVPQRCLHDRIRQEKSTSKSHTRTDVSVPEEGVYASISQPYHQVSVSSLLASREGVFAQEVLCLH